MGLPAGTRVGPYEVIAALGAGGMGEVYRARDPKLGRDVALKVLPEEFAADPERMARFDREAKVLASLNHPNIASIYGFEVSSGAGTPARAPFPVHALVMELVEGPTLSDRIKAGALPVEEALPIAKQIAEALEYAHERGIIHRDLKPANVKIAPEGVVKLLDFGLAKALEGEASSTNISTSPTISRLATQAGIILGTAAYMSPEQAKGKTVDRRADIWAFGCVLYEMLAGKPAFSGETITDILAAVVKEEPDWMALPAGTQPRLRELLRRCLTKDVRGRMQAIGDARIAVEERLDGAAEPGEAAAARAPLWRRALPWAMAAALATALVAALVLLPLKIRKPAGRVVRFAVVLPAGQTLGTDVRTGTEAMAFSSDGSELAYASMPAEGGDPRLVVRRMDRLETETLPGTEGASAPFFSPDGKWVGFFAQGKLKKVSVDGGEPITLCDAANGRGGAWLADGTIIFSPSINSGLIKVPAGGGTPAALTTLPVSRHEMSHRWPVLLPDGKHLLFVVGLAGNEANFDRGRIAVLSLETAESRVLLDGGTMPEYVPASGPNGYLLYARDGDLFAAPFDVSQLKVTGQPVPVVQGVKESVATGSAMFAVAANGSLAYVSGAEENGGFELAWLDRNGAVQPIPIPARPIPVSGGPMSPTLSPDGRKAALGGGELQFGGSGADIFVWDFTRQVLSRLTFTGASSRGVWTPDGKRVAYAAPSPQRGIYWKAADGSGQAEALGPLPGFGSPTSFSPDGRYLAFTHATSAGISVWILPLEGTRKPYQLIGGRGNSRDGQFSPDGRWLAYESDESGDDSIYVQSFPGPGGKWQIASGNSTQPRWSRDGREIYYMAYHKLMEAPVESRPTFSAGAPKELFEKSYIPETGSNFGGPTADGRRFLVTVLSQRGTQAPAAQFDVVLHFAAELGRAAAAPR